MTQNGVEGLSKERPIQEVNFALAARRRSLRSRLRSEILRVWFATAIIGALVVIMAFGGTMTSWGTATSTRAGVASVLVVIALGCILSAIPVLRYANGVHHLHDHRQINHKRNLPYL
jgi:membrane protein YdbS with pleckstrin-like domain